MTEMIRQRVLAQYIEYVSGKDCSEYAEDTISYLGEGEIYTYEQPSVIMFFGRPEHFAYHTVVKYGKYIIDMTSQDKLYEKSVYDCIVGSKGHKGYTTFQGY